MKGIKINILDNLFIKESKNLDMDTAEKISKLIKENIDFSNKGEYNANELNHLKSNKTSETVIDRLKEGFLVYMTNSREDVVACGMLIKKGERYEAKTLHVKSDYRSLGLGQEICRIREEKLKMNGIEELYIESMKYESTIAFHKSRGFIEVPSQRELKYSVYMKKEL